MIKTDFHPQVNNVNWKNVEILHMNNLYLLKPEPLKKPEKEQMQC